jgi:CRISPR-associated protein Cas1
MEPLRPLVDRAVRDVFLEGTSEICRESKVRILAVLAEAIPWRTGKGPLFVELEKMTASLARCFLGQERKLFIPRLL